MTGVRIPVLVHRPGRGAEVVDPAPPTPGHPSGRYEVLGHHGVGIVADTFVTGVAGVRRAVDAHTGTPEQLGASLRGSLTLYLRDTTTDAHHLLPDPFGGGLVFLYRSATVSAASSSLAALVGFLAAEGVEVHKSTAHVAVYAAAWSAGYVPSPYEDITAVGVYSHLVADAAGLRVEEYRSLPRIADGEGTAALREATAEEVRRNVRIAAAADPVSGRIAHLTGGLDSRLVLAATLAEGLTDRFTYYCAGEPTSRDVLAATGVASALGLVMTRYSGMERLIAPTDAAARELWPLRQTCGLRHGPADAGLVHSRALILSGGYGEMLRPYLSRGRAEAPTDPVAAVRAVMGFGSVDHPRRPGLLLPEFAAEVGVGLLDLMAGARADGVPEDALVDHVYFAVRNRYYVGEITRSMGEYSYRFDPLYAPHLPILGLRTPLDERKKGFSHFALMEALQPGLLAMPFDKPRVGPEYRALHPDFEPADPTLGPPRVDGRVHRRPHELGEPTTVAITPALRARAAEAGVSTAFLATVDTAQKTVRSLVAELEGTAFYSQVNRSYVRTLINEPVTDLLAMRQLRALGPMLRWYLDDPVGRVA